MRLADVCTISTGYTPRTRFQSVEVGGVPIVQLGDLSPDGHIDVAGLIKVPHNPGLDRYMVRPGDVLFRSRGARNTAYALSEEFKDPVVAVSPLYILRPNRSLILPNYLAWIINQGPAQRYFDSTARGTNMRMVPKTSLDLLEIRLPAIKSQESIVALDALAERELRLSNLATQKRRQLVSHLLVNWLNKVNDETSEQEEDDD
ncbi:restriction endonuclease subunit S [Streptomyces sp. JHA26]|uniref:restriction endonuclease subunit S n=1 Tax=Streptomyces sp. JHA26 TaxID=1917143 RepID=UPI00098AD6EA|nr:restriction endonuclease subunit S [Streptomyces sp. JHA26]